MHLYCGDELTCRVRSYKGQNLYRDALLPYLDEKHKEQVEKGITTDSTEDQNYPY